MPLSCLIISRDSQEISVFECILGSLHIESVIEANLSLASIRLKKSKIDGVIADCDLEGVESLVRNLTKLAATDSGPAILVSGSRSRADLETLGADFVAPKPISVEEAVRSLGTARNLMLQGRLHYHRHELNTPISITRTKEQISANLLNLSQTGVRVRLMDPHPLHGDVGVHFLLPGTEVPIDAHGEVAWADEGGNVGIRLDGMTEPTKRDLRLWLERQYFQTCSSG